MAAAPCRLRRAAPAQPGPRRPARRRAAARVAAGAQRARALPLPAAAPVGGPAMNDFDPVRIGLVSTSDRAAAGVYADQGIPALQDWLTKALRNPITWETRLVPDEQARISEALIDLVDQARCDLVLTIGGTGPAPRDVTPEATLAVAHRLMPGFGEQMRQISLQFVPTAILSRQCAVVRGKALIINLPGQPKAIQETLEGLKSEAGETLVAGIFAAVPYCVDLIGGPYLETNEDVCKAFRPKSAVRPPH